MTRLERLRQLRAAAMLNAERLPDDQAVKVPTMYEAWAPDTAYQVDDRRSYGDYLYKCVPGSGIVLQYLPSELVGHYFEVA